MTDHLTLTLDTVPPANATLALNGGATVTGDQIVQAQLGTTDFGGGSSDAESMKLWGDVDPTADAAVQTSEGASSFIPFAQEYNVKLSALAGAKMIFARFQDDVANQTVVIQAQILLDLTRPVVAIVVGLDHGRISKVSGHDTASFSWQVNQPFIAYQVRAVASTNAPHTSGVLLGMAHGSTNTSATGSFNASTPIQTIVNGADLEVASPGNTSKIVKVFVQTASNGWSA